MCGNWGLLCLAEFAAEARRRGEAFPEGLEEILRKILVVVEMRGAQAGGVLAMLGSAADLKNGVEAIRVRALKPKRGNLSNEVFRKLRGHLRYRNLFSPFSCCRSTRGGVLVQGHSRFGTSSAPAVLETHPHQWTPTTKTSIWVNDAQVGWRRRVIPLTLTVTHNGDFDAWRPYRDTMVGVGDLGLWLDRVLGVSNRAKGDSPKIAGVMELLACQGIWLHAVRLAYHLHVAVHVEQAAGWMPLEAGAPCTVPDKASLQAWADVFESEFAEVVTQPGPEGSWHPLDTDDIRYDLFVSSVVERLQGGAVEKSLSRWIAKGKVRGFVQIAAAAFRDNDLPAALTAFIRRAEGTFGLTVTSTRFPETVVIAAKGQPVSVGFGGVSQTWSPSIALWTSEPASLGAIVGEDRRGVRARLDLDDQWGELIQLSVRTRAPDAGGAGEDGPGFEVQLKEQSGATDGKYLHAIGLHLGKQAVAEEDWAPELLTAEVFRNRLTWLTKSSEPGVAAKDDAGVAEGQKKNRKSASNALSVKDPVAHDLKQIPGLLREIDLCWSDRASLNFESAQHFAALLLARAEAARKVPTAVRVVDVLVLGIENSLWLGQQFCADLSQLFPGIHAVALSSNVALGLLQSGPGQIHPYNFVYGRDNFHVGPNTIGLVLSHSGTTYPTVWAARFLHQRTEHVFSVSSSFDCLLSVSIGQAPGQASTRRLFSTMAGVRPAEAATAATVAMHHTLSHLLLHCAASATQTRLPSLQENTRVAILEGTAFPSPNGGPALLGGESFCSATSEAVKDMQRLLLGLYLSSCASCGVTGSGRPLDAKHRETYDKLRRAGRTWSHHITEGYWATFLPALYVLVTVACGVPLISTVGGHALGDEHSEAVLEALAWCFRTLDALLYVFLGIIVAMIHRVFTNRRLWARFTTRTLLVVESTVNYKLLRAYASKLLALSWRFATLSVVGQNGTDHFVHEFTHKAQSDVLVALGRPDGRLHSAAAAESSILMSVQQAKFIKRQGKGIEVYSLGHNPWTRPGLCKQALTLPTLRPLFAGEQILMHDRIAQGRSGHGSHGLSPPAILQRWSDLLERKLDPMGMPGIRLSLEALQSLRGKATGTISFKEAVRLLSTLLEKQRQEAQVESVPLALGRFLMQYCTEHPSRTSVVVHSPGKNYTSPGRIYDFEDTPTPTTRFPELTPPCPKSSADFQRSISGGSSQGGDDFTRLTSRGGDLGAKHSSGDKLLLTIAEGQDLSTPVAANNAEFRIALQKSLTGGTAQQQNSMRTTKDRNGFNPSQASLECDEFLALVHGSELQNWVRNMRYRWTMIRQVKGLLAHFAEELKGRKWAPSFVLSGGITISSILLAWKQEAKRSPDSPKRRLTAPKAVDATLLQDAFLSERARNSSRQRSQEDADFDCEWAPHASVRVVGQHLLDEGIKEPAVLEGLRTTELFHEARVASAERLISWYVLFHAMAEPSSRLPFLNYELGKTESRLRVASTPAPVAVHSGALASSAAAVKEAREEQAALNEEFEI